jgi:hypothetical protein
MSNLSFSAPFIRGFTHLDATVGTSVSTILAAAVTPQRRVVVVVQNKSASETIQVIMADTGSSGILIPPLGNIDFDNYNGVIRAIASAAGTPVHIAYAVV